MSTDRLRATILARAADDAEATRAETEARAAAELERARAEAQALLEQAKAEGRRAGSLESARTRALARRRAGELVLAARQGVFESFRREAHVAALALRGDEEYPALVDRLAAEARLALGVDAVVDLDPADVGGVVARAGRRSVDLTLPALADRCIAGLGARVEELWR